MSDEFPYEGARDEVLFQRELKKLSDDMMLSADPIGRIKDLQSRLTAAETRVKELERTLRDRGVRNLINVIDRTCPKCGHDTTEDGCLNCVLVHIDSEILANETGMIDARDHGRWEQYNRLEGGKSELLSLKQFAADLRAELDKLKSK